MNGIIKYYNGCARTVLYEGLENILRARTGALIVVGDSER